MTRSSGYRAGEVFLIPIDTDRYCVGQVLAQYKDTELFFLAALDCTVTSPSTSVDPTEIGALPILLLVNTFDVLLENGAWPVLFNVAPVLERVPFPYYKVGMAGRLFLESWDGASRKPISQSEAERYGFRSGVAPIRFEKAVKAHFGVGEWHPSFDEFRIQNIEPCSMRRSSTPNARPKSGKLPILDRLKSFFRRPRVIAQAPLESAWQDSTVFVYVKIPEQIGPLDRAEKYEDPIAELLDAEGLGEVTGGGTMLTAPDESGAKQIHYCGIDVDLVDLERGLPVLRSKLQELGVPLGTVLEYRLGDEEIEDPVYESA